MPTHHKTKVVLIASLVSAAINSSLAILKIIIGTIGHSQALVADGLHSFSDLISDALVYFAARASHREPDPQHPYGHQRIETVATVIMAIFLLLVGGSICYDALHRIILHSVLPPPSIHVLMVAVISIIANEWLFYYTRKKGESIHSTLLISNAWHNRTDAFVSIIVLLSAAGGLLGIRWLDAVGAVIIAFLIIQIGVKMIWDAGKELIDSGVDEKTLATIQTVIQSVPGVQSIHQLRTRLHGGYIFVDCHILVDPLISVSEGHYIGEQVHLTLLKEIENLTDVVVHIDPENDEIIKPSAHLPNRKKIKEILKTRWSHLPEYNHIQKMTLHYLNGYLHIELYFPDSIRDHHTPIELLSKYQKAVRDVREIAHVTIHYCHD